uniref:Uncharacterized protein n=1 Tax=Arundo donax TaxID=35708 RepID=A0A0A8Z7K3_ARUDO
MNRTSEPKQRAELKTSNHLGKLRGPVWHQDQDKLHLIVAGWQVQDDGEQPRHGAAGPAADDEVLVLGLVLEPTAQRGEALVVDREVPPGSLVEIVHAAVLPGGVVEDDKPRRHVQGLLH